MSILPKSYNHKTKWVSNTPSILCQGPRSPVKSLMISLCNLLWVVISKLILRFAYKWVSWKVNGPPHASSVPHLALHHCVACCKAHPPELDSTLGLPQWLCELKWVWVPTRGLVFKFEPHCMAVLAWRKVIFGELSTGEGLPFYYSNRGAMPVSSHLGHPRDPRQIAKYQMLFWVLDPRLPDSGDLVLNSRMAIFKIRLCSPVLSLWY
jgi:hypothetical protein